MAAQAPSLPDRDDIVRLVDAFYEKVQRDGVLGPVFNHIANTFVDSFVKRAGQVYRAGQGSAA